MKWYMKWIIYELRIWNQVKLWRRWAMKPLWSHLWRGNESTMKWYMNIRTHKWPAPNVSGFIAQLVRASHRYREVTGSNVWGDFLRCGLLKNLGTSPTAPEPACTLVHFDVAAIYEPDGVAVSFSLPSGYLDLPCGTMFHIRGFL